MEHARKMVLVPHECVERLQHQQNFKTVQTPGTVTSRLDAEMNEILNSPLYKTDREKWLQYSQILKRYLHFNEASKPAISDQQEDAAIDESATADTAKSQDSPQLQLDIVGCVPKKFQPMAAQLLQYLGFHKNIAWDEHGVVSIDGAQIAGANIIDLVNHCMRTRKRPNPRGYSEFARALRRINTPHTYIGNKKVLADIATLSPPPRQSTPQSERAGKSQHEKTLLGSLSPLSYSLSSSSSAAASTDAENRGQSVGKTRTKKKKNQNRWSRLGANW